MSITSLRCLEEAVLEGGSDRMTSKGWFTMSPGIGKPDVGQQLRGLAKSFPKVVAQQNAQEKELADAFRKVERIPDEECGGTVRVRMMLPLFAENSNETATLFDAIGYAEATRREDPEEYEELVKFARAHSGKLLGAIGKIREAMASIEKEADALVWHAPWRRYTRWGSFQRQVEEFGPALRKLLSK